MEIMKDRKKICVFCSSNKDFDKVYVEEAKDFGRLIAKEGFDVVWGGCDMGSMGAVAEGAQSAGGKVIGIIPQHFIDRGMAYRNADELVVVRDLQERKRLMQERSDAFVVLPGGFGTLDELFDVLAAQIVRMKAGAAVKPVAILNSREFFKTLQSFIEDLYSFRLAELKYRELYAFLDSGEELASYLHHALK